MRVDNVSRAGPRQELANALAVIFAQRLDADACHYPREIGLLAPITPDLTNYRGACPQRRAELMQHAQLGTYRPVAPVHSD